MLYFNLHRVKGELVIYGEIYRSTDLDITGVSQSGYKFIGSSEYVILLLKQNHTV